MTQQPAGFADLGPLREQAERRREQKAWNWYDWANSAYYTTVLTVLFAPFMITVAGRAAGCGDSGRHPAVTATAGTPRSSAPCKLDRAQRRTVARALADIRHLRLAINRWEPFRKLAVDDSDFDPVREEPAFKELVGR